MPSYSKKISVSGHTADELYTKISTEIDKMMGKLPVGKFDIQRDPQKKQVSLKSSMASATLTCLDDNLVLDAKLSLMATPFKAKIDETIDHWVKKVFPRSNA
ncbi:polyhydroxyalkanoic acid system family protein [bacterium]|jgi:hypothetical protein|nr:polyhydroxyalkanoic acid system family protein [bacterium]